MLTPSWPATSYWFNMLPASNVPSRVCPRTAS